MVGTNCKAIAPGIWVRFLPHDCGVGKTEVRVIGIPNKGMNTMLGNTTIKSIPAHFLHSDGNFQFYDITRKVLFSGDLGASLVHHHVAAKPVAD